MVRNKQVRNINKAIKLLEDKDICVLTGAGISTNSGIPDYRGAGTAPKKPLDFIPFITDEKYRKEFWIDGYQDWKDFSPAEPNAAHIAIASLQHAGFVNGVITQNVDGLHWVDDQQVVAELHGNMYVTECLACGHKFDTADIVQKLELGNPGLLTGDVDRENFWIPNCEVCTGIIKPAVVFFGESLREDSFLLATAIAQDADAMIVAGTSLNVLSPLTFVQMMKSAGKPVIIINKGRTMIDKLADVKINMDLSEAFMTIADRLMTPVYI